MCCTKKELVKIKTENIKLDAFLKYIGKTSTGGEAKTLIKEGKVLVNDVLCLSRGKKIFSGDSIKLKSSSPEVYEVKYCEDS